MQLKDIFSASSDGVSQPSNSSLRFKQKALAASILVALAIIAFIAVEASDTKPARKAPPEAAMITLRPDGTDKDVLIARYDANFLALSRRIEEVQREAAATETRLRAIIADQKSRLETQTSEVKDLKAILESISWLESAPCQYSTHRSHTKLLASIWLLQRSTLITRNPISLTGLPTTSVMNSLRSRLKFEDESSQLTSYSCSKIYFRRLW